ncbi:hypothetical protein [Streptococcus sp. S784/96/1]|uniref:hypothetical protein n=1 Tax=Streptococcus sp. S784/96/1 TaxID=2653499 RepID=UPI0013896464|nr:hypothetical protein [Streptococcus sp. S784/96/1]
MYSAKLFKVSKTGSIGSLFGGKSAGTDSGMMISIYQQIADYANKHNLDVVKISDTNETLLGKDGVAVLFKSK